MKTLYKLMAWIWGCFALANLLGFLLVISDPVVSQFIPVMFFILMAVGTICSFALGFLIMTGQSGELVRFLAWLLCLYLPFGTFLAIFTLIAAYHPENRDA